MGNGIKDEFLRKLHERYGTWRKLERSKSLYEAKQGDIRIYIRYSAVHPVGKTFYGLRKTDLEQLESHPSVVCFLWDDQKEPLVIPFSEFEDVFHTTKPANDGQYKVQVYLNSDVTELYIAQIGRFNVEGHFGWEALDALFGSSQLSDIPDLTHSQIQTLIGAIGTAKGYDVWIPQIDRLKLDWTLTSSYVCRSLLPMGFEQINTILQEVDVIWIQRGSSELKVLFEVEHSTPIYSGLLRFNDIHLVAPNLNPRFHIVSNEARRSLYVRQLNRPTFQTSGLGSLCTFLEYTNVFEWHKRVMKG